MSLSRRFNLFDPWKVGGAMGTSRPTFLFKMR